MVRNYGMKLALKKIASRLEDFTQKSRTNGGSFSLQVIFLTESFDGVFHLVQYSIGILTYCMLQISPLLLLFCV